MELLTRNYEYRLRPNQTFVARASAVLEESRQLYNAALAHRIAAYQSEGKSVSIYDQQKELTELRSEYPEYAVTNRTIQREALDRVEKAYQAFFRRVKAGAVAGFPRFKGFQRWESFAVTIDPRHACPLMGDKLKVASVGTCRVRLHRPLPEGAVIKTVRVVRRADGWYAVLALSFPFTPPARVNEEVVGLDMGIAQFAALSNGKFVENPRYGEAGQKLLTARSQRLAHKPKRKSKRRAQAKRLVAKAHLKVARQRKHFQYETIKTLLLCFGVIAIEDLRVKNMVRNHCLARVISDVAWSAFYGRLICKAEEAGGLILKVNPRNTSRTCSRCGHCAAENRETQAEFVCVACGFRCNADTNAALNIRSRGLDVLTKPVRQQEVGLAEMSNTMLQVASPLLA